LKGFIAELPLFSAIYPFIANYHYLYTVNAINTVNRAYKPVVQTLITAKPGTPSGPTKNPLIYDHAIYTNHNHLICLDTILVIVLMTTYSKLASISREMRKSREFVLPSSNPQARRGAHPLFQSPRPGPARNLGPTDWPTAKLRKGEHQHQVYCPSTTSPTDHNCLLRTPSSPSTTLPYTALPPSSPARDTATRRLFHTPRPSSLKALPPSRLWGISVLPPP
jgi:hypothetical protein